jgi:hypothetical protein
MLDQILSSLQSQAAPQLISKLGLNETQAKGSITAAADSVKEAISGGKGFGMADALSLFSSAKNSAGADGLLNNIGNIFSQKLTSNVGLDASKAGSVKDLVLPMVMKLMSDKVGGNAASLQGLIGGLAGANAGGIGKIASGFLGKLFK